MWWDGFYGRNGHRRPRYKCIQADGTRHVFTERPLPRAIPPSGDCYECERTYHRDDGPQTARRAAFTAREIASALVQVGRGVSYRQAGRDLRDRAERFTMTPWGRQYATRHGSLVSDLVEMYAPVVVAPSLPRRAPTTVVLDTLPFHVGKLKNGLPSTSGRLLFHVFAAVGYTRRNEAYVLGLAAYPSNSSADWQHFLATLPGPPDRVITDEATGILKALPIAWPTADVFLCQWHIFDQGVRKLKAAGLHNRFGPLYQLLSAALQQGSGQPDPARWEDFCQAARCYPNAVKLQRWLDEKQELVHRQLSTRYWPVSNGAVEQKLRFVKNALFDRRFAYGNRERTNHLLTLMQLEANDRAREPVYAKRIRDQLTQSDGQSPVRRAILDGRGTRSIRR